MNTTISPIAIPTPGTPAYWTAQREAFALIHDWQRRTDDLEEELDLLRRIATHPFATRVMHARGRPVERRIASLERMFDGSGAVDGDDEADPDGPPHGDDWCRRGCQPLFGMECGMCGYDGPGVWADQTDTVAEYCCHCKARTYQRPDGICTLCGKDAETPDETAPQAALCFQVAKYCRHCKAGTYQSLKGICTLCGNNAETPDEAAPQAALCFQECGTVTTNTQCGLCRDLENHARSAAAGTAQHGHATPGLATAAALARTALACRGALRVDGPCP